MKVKCPYCKTETIYSTDNKYRPFCSEKCHLIDLGEWVEGNYAISDKNDPLQDLEREKIVSSE